MLLRTHFGVLHSNISFKGKTTINFQVVQGLKAMNNDSIDSDIAQQVDNTLHARNSQTHNILHSVLSPKVALGVHYLSIGIWYHHKYRDTV